MRGTNPFTRTPGIAGNAYIDMHYADEIIECFSDPDSYQFIYKIVGLRGSGKSVEYRKVMNHFSNEPGWLAFTLSAAGNPTSTLIAKLAQSKYLSDSRHTSTVSVNSDGQMNLLVAQGGVGITYSHTTEKDPALFSEEARLAEMIQSVNSHGCRLLVGIDDISKTSEMVKFLSIWGAMLLDDRLKIYLLCTGLSKNIEDFSSEQNLSFFKRSESVETGLLNKFDIASMYSRLLGVDEARAVELTKLSGCYAYAYQVLGSLYFKKNPSDPIEAIIPDYEKALFHDSYELIWSTLTESEKDLTRAIVMSPSGKVSEIKEIMGNAASFDTLRIRLANKHLINTDQRGYIRIHLPSFKKFVTLWHTEE